MDAVSYKTVSLNDKTVKKEWVIVDATDMVVGRLSTKVAMILRGKHKASYTPHVDCGDNVIIVNAEKIRFTGNKLADKVYVRHTGYPGGQRFSSPVTVLKSHPERVLEMSIRGMLPKGRLGRAIFRNLYVYKGTEHPHAGQKPKEIKIA